MEDVRILLVDPHAIVREGLRLMLESHGGFVVVGEAEEGREAIELAERLRPDVAVLEARLSGLSGIEAAEGIHDAGGSNRVLIISGSASRTAVEDALRAGVAGFLLKSSSPKELVDAIQLIHAGGHYLSPSLTDHLVEALAQPRDSDEVSLMQLTSREREVLRHIAEGLSSKEAASAMGVSQKTVESHRSNVMTKLGIHKAAGLVRFAVREGIVEA